jgi:hypothetical protein
LLRDRISNYYVSGTGQKAGKERTIINLERDKLKRYIRRVIDIVILSDNCKMAPESRKMLPKPDSSCW